MTIPDAGPGADRDGGLTTDAPSLAAADVALLQTSRVMAIGTLISRASGFLRTVVIAAVVGTAAFGDAYNVPNTIPNIIYELLLGGVLTSVVVPLLVRAERRPVDRATGELGGVAYAQRLLTVVTVVLSGLTIVAIVLAPLLVHLYMPHAPHQQLVLATTFGRFFLAQIVFYGVGATIGAVLNVRGHFAAPMWAPIVNNAVVIATGVAFLSVVNGAPVPGLVSNGAVTLLAVGTTAGIVAQTVALLPPLRASGFRWRWRFDWRGSGLGEIRTVGSWVLVYVLVNQLGLFVVLRLATSAASGGPRHLAIGYSSYLYAFLLFSLPHAVVTVSVVTALLPRMSRHAGAGAHDEVRADLSRGLRLSAAVLVPATAAFIALGRQIGVVVYNHHVISIASAHYIGTVLTAFALGLVPFSFFQLLLRGYYAMQDTRTPALINIWVNATNIAVDVALYLTLPDRWRIVGLAVGYAASYAVGLALMSRSLGRTLGGLDGYRVTRTVVRLGVAGILGGAVAAGIAAGAQVLVGNGQLGAWTGLLLGAAAGGWLFVRAATRMQVAELTAVRAALGGRFARPGPAAGAAADPPVE